MNSEIHPYIVKRKSIVTFSEKQINDHIANSLFEAARWAPSSFNQQPWRFIYALRQDSKEFKYLHGLLYEGNKSWTTKASLLGISITETVSSHNQKPNKYSFHDVGLAMGGLIFQAMHLGLQVHQMGGFDGVKAKQILQIPHPFEPVAMFAVGYASDNPDSFPSDLKKREETPRKRREINETVFRGIWKSQS